MSADAPRAKKTRLAWKANMEDGANPAFVDAREQLREKRRNLRAELAKSNRLVLKADQGCKYEGSRTDASFNAAAFSMFQAEKVLGEEAVTVCKKRLAEIDEQEKQLEALDLSCDMDTFVQDYCQARNPAPFYHGLICSVAKLTMLDDVCRKSLVQFVKDRIKMTRELLRDTKNKKGD